MTSKVNNNSVYLPPHGTEHQNTENPGDENDDDNYDGKLLHLSCVWNNSDLLGDLLLGDEAKNINSQDRKGRTALHEAVASDSLECARMLLMNGADPNIRYQDDQNGGTEEKAPPSKSALHLACQRGNLEMVRLLLEFHADPFLRDAEGHTPMDLVSGTDEHVTVTIHDELQAAIVAHESNLYNSLAIAVHKGDPELIRKLLDEAIDDDSDDTAAARLQSIVNYVPNDATNTLLFKACQEGHLDVVKQLLRAGADGRRQHPATKYSPLYIAAYHGRLSICQLLLDKFPEMASVYTVEHWLPIHAAIINGHQDIVQLLLTYPYPNRILKQFFINSNPESGNTTGNSKNTRRKSTTMKKSCDNDNSQSQNLMYLMPFDVNAQDIAGQTILYLAILYMTNNNQSLIELLLKFKVKAFESIENEFDEFMDCLSTTGSSTGSSSPDITVIQPLQQQQKRPSQMKMSTNSDSVRNRESEKIYYEINPIKIDVYCNHKSETALHCAVKKRYYSIASMLLEHGADPNLPIIGTGADHTSGGGSIVTRVSHFNHNLFSPRLSLSESLKDLKSLNTPPGTEIPPTESHENRRSIKSTALREAVKNRDSAMVDMLLRFGAIDDIDAEDCDHHHGGSQSALSIAFSNQDYHFVSKLLSLKAYPDSEFKINRRSFDSASFNNRFQNPLSLSNNLTVSSMFPSNPVMIDWQCLKIDSVPGGVEESLQRNLTQWLIDAALVYNVKLKLSQIPLDCGRWNTALAAITRIDLSGNGLTTVPLALFTDLPSLKILNLSKNKLQTLPEMKIFEKTTLDDEVFRNLELNSNTSSSQQKPPPAPPSKLFSMMRKSHSVTAALSSSSKSMGNRSGGSRSNRRSIDAECSWNLPCLEELYLQDNQLECLPSSLFQQPELKILDLSNNKLRTLPPMFWFSPKLSELNLSMNLLCDLPSPINFLGQTFGDNNRRGSPPINTPTGSMSKSVSTSSLASSNISVNELKLELLPDPGSSTPSTNTVTANLIPFELNILKPWHGAVTVLDDTFQDDDVNELFRDNKSIKDSMISASSSSPRNSMQSFAGSIGAGKNHQGQCSLTQLNLSHNGFYRIPFLLSCLATRLTHLNLSYNRLRSIFDPYHIMGHYPMQLKHLDLSHNQISEWISNDDPENNDLDISFEDHQCYHYFLRQQKTPTTTTEKFICPYKQHLKLDCLKTLILSHNHLKNLVITREELVTLLDGPPMDKSNNHHGGFLPFNLSSSFGSHDSSSQQLSSSGKFSLASKLLSATSFAGSQDDLSGQNPDDNNININYKACRYSKLFFPNLSMLDVANNQIAKIPKTISYLYHLSVLNLSGNTELTGLPPEMGLLTKLWNLNTRGCLSMEEPLRSMINSKSYKTSDIISYLNSILENSKPYTRLKLMIVGYQSIGKTTLLEQLRQEGISRSRNRTPTPDHWGKRMGNRSMNMKTPRGVTLSTVGVDLCEWTYEWRPLKGGPNSRDRSLSRTRLATIQQQNRNRSSLSGDGNPSIGPITFRTWDFGGQREYYATHQYFLSKRSIYLVVWKITDGEKGVHGMHPWLVNIQSRAPNSPVIIVGTHYDLVKEFYPPFYASELQSLIRERYMSGAADADKRGLPKVVASIEVSAKTRFNIRFLANVIYETAVEMRSPGGKDRLLEQKVPATYLALEEIVTAMALERKSEGLEPVLYGDQYRQEVVHHMKERYDLSFRDYSELQQATRFLHENGVLLHYEDANLKDLYFLDPQWLCDMLAHVVTIREINPFVKNGIMKTEHLSQLFKNTANAPLDVQGYLLSLLNKFELAITWDNRTLLIPSLLPTEDQLRSGHSGWDIAIPLRSRLKIRTAFSSPADGMKATETAVKFQFRNQLNFQEFSGSLKKYAMAALKEETSDDATNERPSCSVTALSCHSRSIHRILTLSYVPCGFWSRLIARVLADESVIEIVRSFYSIPLDSDSDPSLAEFFDRLKTSWHCWQTGFGLRYLDTFLIRVKEFTVFNHTGMEAKFSINATWKSPRYPYDYNKIRFFLRHQKECSQEPTAAAEWSETISQNSSLIEIYLPNQSLVVETCYLDQRENRYRNCTYVLEPNMEMLTKLLVIIVEHIDTLLEDWYPSLGTRFIHTSDGRFLITRMVPCTSCMESFIQSTTDVHHLREPNKPKEILSPDTSEVDSNLVDFYKSEVKKAAMEANTNERKPPVAPKKQQETGTEATEALALLSSSSLTRHPVYAFMVEECILSVYENRRLDCPRHARVRMERIAPDFMFQDMKESYRIESDQLKFGKLLGRGSFGFVFRAYYRPRNSMPNVKELKLNPKLTTTNVANSTFYVSEKQTTGLVEQQEVALKLLQPIKLELGSANNIGIRKADIEAYTAMRSKWERDPLQYSCKAYCTARTELNILLNLKHSNIASIIGICPKPLALVLILAPLGSLDSHVKSFRRSGARISAMVLQKTFLQISKALEYLHQQHIIYRDLKSENVLVWAFPQPYSTSKNYSSDDVRLKLADYGISRSSLPTGTKGFGGTEGFMAPEIMLFNGEEEYTEKVDCFSFAMFMYELSTLRFPFEGQEFAIRESILDGIRPAISKKDLDNLPESFIDLMTRAWAHEPGDRPTMSQIVSIISAPEFCSLRDVATLPDNCALICAAGFAKDDVDNPKRFGLFLSKIGQQVDLLEVSGSKWNRTGHRFSCEHLNKRTITSVCIVDRNQLWLGDSMATLNVYRFNSNSDEVTSFRLLCMIRLDNENPASLTAIKSIQWMANAQLVAICSNNGELWLLKYKRLTNELGIEGSVTGSITSSALGMIRIESNENNWPTLCVSNVAIDCGGGGGQFEIWCGQTEGKITVLSLLIDNNSDDDRRSAFKIQSQTTMDHYDDVHFLQQQSHHQVPMVERNDVFMLIGSNDQSFISSVLYSGFIIYQWDVSKRAIARRLDCSKLAPCSESLMSISIEDHLKPNNCRISEVAINDDNNEIYVGTNFGCIIVAESLSLKPITVFRPYHREVKFIIPLNTTNHDQQETGPDTDQIPKPEQPPSPLSIKNIWPFKRQSSVTTAVTVKPPLTNDRKGALPPPATGKRIKPFVTIGRGYRNLLGRFAGSSGETGKKSNQQSTDDTGKFHAIVWDSGFWDLS